MAPKKVAQVDDDAVVSEALKCDVSKLVVGSVMSRVNYITVMKINSDSVEVKDTTGMVWTISNSILEAQAHTADQFTSTKKVTRIELARTMEEELRDTVFSCAFNKLPNANEQEKLLEEADLTTPAKRKKVARELGVGPERVMIGHVTDTHGNTISY